MYYYVFGPMTHVLREQAQPATYMHTYIHAYIHDNIHYKNLQEFTIITRMYKNFQEFTRIYKNLQEFARIYKIL